MWARNATQRDIVQMLNQEGYNIGEREVMRLRGRLRMLMRKPNGQSKKYDSIAQENVQEQSPSGENSADQQAVAAQDEGAEEALNRLITDLDQDGSARLRAQLMEAGYQDAEPMPLPVQSPASATTPSAHSERIGGASPHASLHGTGSHHPGELQSDSAARYEERRQQLQIESDEKYRNKKRRRRIRGYAGLPPDPEGPPRFPSETTIHEAQKHLCLDKALYKDIRDRFTSICGEMGIRKKTQAGDVLWNEAKARLVTETPHLQQMLSIPHITAATSQPSLSGVTETQAHQHQLDDTTLSLLRQRELCLDCLCTDVTKRIRTTTTRMTIAQAKNILGINPNQSREIRDAFYDILKADSFESRLACGQGRWEELKRRWISETPLVREIMSHDRAAGEEEEVAYQEKEKAGECLCRDVMKRLRDDMADREALRNRKRKASSSNTLDNPTAVAMPSPNTSSSSTVPPLPSTETAGQSQPVVNAEANDVSQGPSADDVALSGISTLASQALAQSGAAGYADYSIDPALGAGGVYYEA